MTSIPLPFADQRLSIVTIGDGASTPAWQRMFGWADDGAGAVPVDARSPAARTIWAAKLDRAVREADARVLLVAEGIGCAASAWWARLSPAHDVRKIAGALLFAPPAAAQSLYASPKVRLPFPSLVIRPGEMADDLAATVEDWGSRLVVGDRLRNRDAGGVAWRQAQRLFLRLTRQMVDHEVDRGRAITGWR